MARPLDGEKLIIGIGGATCSGKTTLAQRFHKNIPESHILQQDDYFILNLDDPRHTKVPEVNHINFEILSSLETDALYRDIQKALQLSSKVLILEGFLIFNEPRIAELCHLKLYLTLDRDECWKRRSGRVYDPPDPPGYFDLCVWPCYCKHLEQVRQSDYDIFYLDGSLSPDFLYEEAFKYVRTSLQSSSKSGTILKS